MKWRAVRMSLKGMHMRHVGEPQCGYHSVWYVCGRHKTENQKRLYTRIYGIQRKAHQTACKVSWVEIIFENIAYFMQCY